MTLVLIRPGQCSALLSLQSVLRERHEQLAASTVREIERRQKLGTPLSDAVDFDALAAAVAARDVPLARTLVSGGALEPLDAYAAVDGYDDVKLRIKALGDGARADLLLDVSLAQAERSALEGAPVREAGKTARAADEALFVAHLAFMRAAIAKLEVGGVAVDLADTNDVEAVRATGTLAVHLFVASRDFQGLPPGKEPRFGS